MNQSPAPFAAEIGVVRNAYAALNRGDVRAFVQDFDPQIERFEQSDPPEAGIFRGLESVIAHVTQARDTWAEGGCEPQRFTVAGNRVIVDVRVRVRLKREAEWRQGDVVDVYTFRDGKVMEFRTFFDQTLARAWLASHAAGTP